MFVEGCIPACKLALEVRGATGIQDVDNKNRTPLHLATLSAHGEMIDFLLEGGGEIYCTFCGSRVHQCIPRKGSFRL